MNRIARTIAIIAIVTSAQAHATEEWSNYPTFIAFERITADHMVLEIAQKLPTSEIAGFVRSVILEDDEGTDGTTLDLAEWSLQYVDWNQLTKRIKNQ